MSFEEMHPIFGRVVPEWSDPPPHTTPSPPFLFRVHGHGSDHSALRVIATNFRSNTFEAIKSRQQLEDLRDDIGIGGSWSGFVDYVTTSLKSRDVKLIMEGSSRTGGADYAKLIAQKAKGMPRVSFSLSKLVDGAAGEAMANIALELYKEFKDVNSLLIEAANLYLSRREIISRKRLYFHSKRFLLHCQVHCQVHCHSPPTHDPVRNMDSIWTLLNIWTQYGHSFSVRGHAVIH